MALRLLAIAGSALVSMAAAQTEVISALPEVSGPAQNPCGGCFVVADVAGIIFGGVFTSTQTNMVSIISGRNGSVTTTSIVESNGQATFVSGMPLTNNVPVSFNPLSSVITVKGATLTSPTSYEVFSAYSVTRNVSGPGGCSVSSGSAVQLPSAFSYPIPDNPPSDFLVIAESSFIAAIGSAECSAGGGNVQSTIHSMITTTTQHITTTGLIRPTPQAQSTVASSTVAPSVTSASQTSTVVVFSNSSATGGIGQATFTIVPFTGVGARAVPSWAPVAAFFMCAAALVHAL